MENHIEKIIDMPKYSEQPDNEDIKVELITILKQFLDTCVPDTIQTVIQVSFGLILR